MSEPEVSEPAVSEPAAELSRPPGLWPVTGDGVLARHGGLILLTSLESGQFVDRLLDLHEEIAAAGGDGRRFADAIADAVEAGALTTGAAGTDAAGSAAVAGAAGSDPSVLAFGAAGSGMAVTVSGDAWVDVTTAYGTQRIAAGQPAMLVRCVLRSPVSAVRGGLGHSDGDAVRTDRFSRLDAGTVRAGGLSYYVGGAVSGGHAVPGGQVGGGAARPSGARPVSTHAPPEAEPAPAEPAPAEPAPAEPAPAEPAPAELPQGELDSAEPSQAWPPQAVSAQAGQAAQPPDTADEPESAWPAQAESPQAESPQAEFPQPEAPEPEAPQAGYPQAEPPQAEYPQAEPPQAEYPQAEPPQAEYLQAEPPQAVYPQAEPPQAVFGSADFGQTELDHSEFALTELEQATPPGQPPAGAGLLPGWHGQADSPPAELRQPTELWSPPPGAGSGEALPPVGSADLVEREVTIPPVDAEPFESVLLLPTEPGQDLDIPQREPLSKVTDLPPGSSSYAADAPIIQGVYCKNAHFDNPEALFCAVCGISMNQQTLVPRPGPRPPLGVLVLDDGSVFQLDSDYIVGREPGLDASVASGQARPLRVTDDSGIVSRVHLRVHLDGWRVYITDLGSANGTRVKQPRDPVDQALLPQVPMALTAGSEIDLGGRGFRYESHRGQ